MARRVRMSPLPTTPLESDATRKWLTDLGTRVGSGPFVIQGYAANALPSPATWGSVSASDPFSSLIFVLTTPPCVAYTDGTNWINITTGTPL